MRTGLAVVLAAAVTACASRPEVPRVVAKQDTITKSSFLLKRLAQAADGYRDGKDRYVVAGLEFPHKVIGVFLTKAGADSLAADSTTEARSFATFGPFRTALEPGIAAEVDNVDSVVVYYLEGDPSVYHGETVDALFWGISAFDLFVAPYLTRVYGAAYAASQREAYKQGRLSNSALPHYRKSF
jgi:hypothetical protein